MKRLAFLLPLLVLAAAPCLAQDPATNAPAADESHAENAEPLLYSEVFRLAHALASEVAVDLNRIVSEQQLSLGRGWIQADERINGLVVVVPDSTMKVIRESIAALDVAPTRVRLRITAIETAEETISDKFENGGIVQKETPERLCDSGAKILFAPVAVAQVGQTATVESYDKEYDPDGKPSTPIMFGSRTTSLHVTPVVREQGRISLTVSAEYSFDGGPVRKLEESSAETGAGEVAVFTTPGAEGKRILLFIAPEILDPDSEKDPPRQDGGTPDSANPKSYLKSSENPATPPPGPSPAADGVPTP